LPADGQRVQVQRSKENYSIRKIKAELVGHHTFRVKGNAVTELAGYELYKRVFFS
jgi:hypothetical protein